MFSDNYTLAQTFFALLLSQHASISLMIGMLSLFFWIADELMFSMVVVCSSWFSNLPCIWNTYSWRSAGVCTSVCAQLGYGAYRIVTKLKHGSTLFLQETRQLWLTVFSLPLVSEKHGYNSPGLANLYVSEDDTLAGKQTESREEISALAIADVNTLRVVCPRCSSSCSFDRASNSVDFIALDVASLFVITTSWVVL